MQWRSTGDTAGNGWKCLVLTALIMAGIQLSVMSQQGSGSEDVRTLLDSLKHYTVHAPSRVAGIGRKILEVLPEKGNERVHFQVAMDCANAAKMRSEFEQARIHSDRAVQMATMIGDQDLLIKSLFSKATVFNVSEQTDSTIIYYQKVIEHTPEDSTTFYLCNAYTGIGTVYWVLGNNEKAEEYLVRGHECSRGIPRKTRAFSIAPLMQFYLKDNDPRYLQYLDTLMSTDFFQLTSSPALIGHFESFLLLNELPEKEKIQRLTEVFNHHAENNGTLDAQVLFGLRLTDHLQSTNRVEKADSILQVLLSRTREQKRRPLEASVLEQLFTFAKGAQDMERALAYSEQLLTVNKQILEDQNRNSVHELNIRFETAAKDHQISEQNIRLEHERRNRYLFIALSVLGLGIAVMTFLYLRHRILVAKRLSEQKKLLHDQEIAHLRREKAFAEKTSSLEASINERNRIARDLHDDVGSALSSIHVFSSAAERAMQTSPDIAKDILQQISSNSRGIMENMSDIVWAINTGTNSRMSLEDKLKNYGYELLTPLGISCIYHIDPQAERMLENIEARKNVLLIAKESMNNLAKYSRATQARITLSLEDENLRLEISDNGVGFVAADSRSGNGLRNMQQRSETLGGQFVLRSVPGNGTTVIAIIPLTSIRDTRRLEHA